MDNNILSDFSQKHRVTIDFSLSSKKLFIYGNVKSTLDCKEQLLQSLQKSHKGSQNDCPICCCPIQGKFILALCGHAYCQGCLMMMMQEELKFPVKCPSFPCPCEISLQDLQQLMCETDFERVLNYSYFENHNNKKTNCRVIKSIKKPTQISRVKNAKPDFVRNFLKKSPILNHNFIIVKVV